jgi:hypothetical protein
MLQHLERAASDRQISAVDPIRPVVPPVNLRKEAGDGPGCRDGVAVGSAVLGPGRREGRGGGFVAGSARGDHVVAIIFGLSTVVNGSDR